MYAIYPKSTVCGRSLFEEVSVPRRCRATVRRSIHQRRNKIFALQGDSEPTDDALNNVTVKLTDSAQSPVADSASRINLGLEADFATKSTASIGASAVVGLAQAPTELPEKVVALPSEEPLEVQDLLNAALDLQPFDVDEQNAEERKTAPEEGVEVADLLNAALGVSPSPIETNVVGEVREVPAADPTIESKQVNELLNSALATPPQPIDLEENLPLLLDDEEQAPKELQVADLATSNHDAVKTDVDESSSTTTPDLDVTNILNVALNQPTTAVDDMLGLKPTESKEEVESKPDVTETLATDSSYANTLMRVVVIVGPALGAVLADPVMSLIDTACLGQAGALGLAALAPNTGIFNFIFSAMYFLQTAVTALVGRALARQQHEDAKKTISHGLFLAAGMGCMITAALLTFPAFWLKLMGAGTEIVPKAMEYLTVRALAAPIVLCSMVCQGAFYGMGNSVAPLTTNVTAGLINVVLDVALIFYFGCGVAGAAWATLAGQAVAASIFVKRLHNKGLISIGKLPTIADLKPFFNVGYVLVIRLLSIMGVFSLATSTAIALGTQSAAAFQVALQLFWFLTFFPEALSTAAQSMIARTPQGPNHAKEVTMVSTVLIALAGVLGLTLAGALGVIPLSLFSQDPTVISVVKNVLPPFMLAIISGTVSIVADGIFIGIGDFNHLAMFQVLNLGAALAVFNFFPHTLETVCWAICGYFCIRSIEHMIAYIVLNWKKFGILRGVTGLLQPQSKLKIA